MLRPSLFRGLLAGSILYFSVGPAGSGSLDWMPERYKEVAGYVAMAEAECRLRPGCRQEGAVFLAPVWRPRDWQVLSPQLRLDLSSWALTQAAAVMSSLPSGLGGQGAAPKG